MKIFCFFFDQSIRHLFDGKNRSVTELFRSRPLYFCRSDQILKIECGFFNVTQKCRVGHLMKMYDCKENLVTTTFILMTRHIFWKNWKFISGFFQVAEQEKMKKTMKREAKHPGSFLLSTEEIKGRKLNCNWDRELEIFLSCMNTVSINHKGCMLVIETLWQQLSL